MPVAALIDQERRDSFTADALHFESQCFITFTYLPPAEGMTRLGDFFIDRPNNKADGAGFLPRPLRSFPRAKWIKS